MEKRDRRAFTGDQVAQARVANVQNHGSIV